MKRDLRKAAKFIKVLPDIVPLEFLALVAGLKPVFYTGLDMKYKRVMQKAWPDLSFASHKREILGGVKQVFTISYDKRLAKECVRQLKASNFSRIGQLLGYPDCCTSAHHERVHLSARDTIYESVKATGSHKFNFLTNNLFNFMTRLKSEEDLKRQKEYFSLNVNLNNFKPFSATGLYPSFFTSLSFISHIPCSYNCRETIELGKKMANLTKEYLPEEYSFLMKFIKYPVLFFDLLDWAILKDVVKNKDGTYRYKELMPPYSLLNEKIFNSINLGNKLEITENKIRIFKGKKPLFQHKKKDEIDGFLLNFK